MIEDSKLEIIKKIKRDFMWYSIVIEDPKALQGESIINTINLLSKAMNFNFIAMSFSFLEVEFKLLVTIL